MDLYLSVIFPNGHPSKPDRIPKQTVPRDTAEVKDAFFFMTVSEILKLYSALPYELQSWKTLSLKCEEREQRLPLGERGSVTSQFM